MLDLNSPLDPSPFWDAPTIPKLPAVYAKLSVAEKRLVREEYARLQNGICPFCNSPLHLPPPKADLPKLDESKFPVGFLRYPLHLHHSHETGLTLACVHSYCNGLLWQIYGE
jgi:hypothetical protein